MGLNDIKQKEDAKKELDALNARIVARNRDAKLERLKEAFDSFDAHFKSVGFEVRGNATSSLMQLGNPYTATATYGSQTFTLQADGTEPVAGPRMILRLPNAHGQATTLTIFITRQDDQPPPKIDRNPFPNDTLDVIKAKTEAAKIEYENHTPSFAYAIQMPNVSQNQAPRRNGPPPPRTAPKFKGYATFHEILNEVAPH